MTDLYRVPLAAVKKAAAKAPAPLTIRAPGTRSYWTWNDGWQGDGAPPKEVEVPDTYWAPPLKKMPKRPRRAKDVVREFAAIIAWWANLYHDGVLSADQATGLARQAALVDQQGTVWSVGLQSGAWYRFDNGWQQTDAPAPDSIVAIEEAVAQDDAVAQGLAHFFRKAKDYAPETMTAAWAAT